MIKGSISRRIGVLGDCVEGASSEVGILILRYKCAEIGDALFGISVRDYRNGKTSGIDRAVLAEDANGVNFLFFDAIEDSKARDFGIVAVIARAGKAIVLRR